VALKMRSFTPHAYANAGQALGGSDARWHNASPEMK